MAVFRPDPHLLERQVDSLKAQTLQEWQCLVALDGRDPEVCLLLKRLVDDDERFRIIEYSENVGHYRNFERLTQLVPRTAAWVAYCDQDDYWYPDKLDRLSSLLRAKPSTAAAVATARVVDSSGNTRGLARRKEGPLSQLLLRNEVTGCFAMFRPEVLELALPFPRPTCTGVHDHWLAVCAAALGDVVFSEDPLQDYVQHEANAIGEPRIPTLKAHLASMRRDGGLFAHLDSISRERWGWRVSMARSMCDRLEVAGQRRLPFLEAVSAGDITPALLGGLANEVITRRLSLRDGLSMAAAALWWRRALAGRRRQAS